MRVPAILAACLALAACSEEALPPKDAAPNDETPGAAARLALTLRSDLVVGQRASEVEAKLPPDLRALLAAEPGCIVPVQLGGESRVAQVLRPGFRAIARASCPSDGARLALAFGALETGRAQGPLALRVTVRSDDAAPRVMRLEIPRGGRWFDRTLDLALPHEAAFELVLELDPDSPPSVLSLAAPVAYAPLASPPTVLLVTSDTHRGDHVEGADRAASLRTPALRALASRGVFFANCYSSTNVTVPSHVAMLTGASPRDTGVTDNRAYLSDEPETLPEIFQAAGYRTFAVTSLNLLSPPNANIGQGFDIVSWTPTTRTADKTVDIALRFLEETPDRPVFAWVHVFDAHGPYQPPPPFEREFYSSGKDPRDPSIELEPGARIPTYLEGVRDTDYIRALYSGEIGFLDSHLARLFAHARVASGVVALTGDHGEVLGLHDVWWAHKDVYPDTLHVPLILAWPGAPAGTRSEDAVVNTDIGRTLLDLAGLGARPFPGRDLTRAAQPSGPRFALGGGRFEASINAGGWHLILQLAPHDDDERQHGRERHQVQLYDLRSDPDCLHDRVDTELAKAKELRAQLIEWLLGWRGERFVDLKHDDAASLGNLAQLGYASDAAAGERDSSAPLFDPACRCAWCARFR